VYSGHPTRPSLRDKASDTRSFLECQDDIRGQIIDPDGVVRRTFCGYNSPWLLLLPCTNQTPCVEAPKPSIIYRVLMRPGCHSPNTDKNSWSLSEKGLDSDFEHLPRDVCNRQVPGRRDEAEYPGACACVNRTGSNMSCMRSLVLFCSRLRLSWWGPGVETLRVIANWLLPPLV